MGIWEPTIGVITDASPKGVGAVLKVRGKGLMMYEAFGAEFTKAEAQWLGSGLG